jgi:hypothetical protein
MRSEDAIADVDQKRTERFESLRLDLHGRNRFGCNPARFTRLPAETGPASPRQSLLALDGAHGLQLFPARPASHGAVAHTTAISRKLLPSPWRARPRASAACSPLFDDSLQRSELDHVNRLRRAVGSS